MEASEAGLEQTCSRPRARSPAMLRVRDESVPILLKNHQSHKICLDAFLSRGARNLRTVGAPQRSFVLSQE